MLMCHNIGVSGHYYRPQESDILEDFMIYAAGALTIDPTKRLQQRVNDPEGKQAQELQRVKELLNKVISDNQSMEIKVSQFVSRPRDSACARMLFNRLLVKLIISIPLYCQMRFTICVRVVHSPSTTGVSSIIF